MERTRTADAYLRLDRVTVAGRARPIVDGISLALARGQTLALLGPDGAGKSALLLTLAGFLPQSFGAVHLDGREITTALPERRNIGAVFAEDGLFPHLAVLDTVAFGLKMRGQSRADRRARAREVLAALGLAALGEKHPGRLDASERRLVALARAVACAPALLLIDEPAAAAPPAEAVRRALRPALAIAQTTAIFATHDRATAFGHADLVALLRDGRLEQLGSPMELFEHPATRFAAGFTGTCNLLPATLLETAGAHARVGLSGGMALATAGQNLAAGPVLVCLRPHRLVLDPAGPLRGTVTRIDYQGALTRVTLHLPEGELVADLAQVPPGLAPGTTLSLGWAAEHAWLVPVAP